MSDYSISTEKNKLDVAFIHAYISRSYWAEGMPKDLLIKAIKHSLCFGVYTNTNEQIGFARVITDKATFAYLADVFIQESHQGRGLGKYLIKTIIEHTDLQGLRRFMLATLDAQDLYEKFGFQSITQYENLMQINQSDLYTKEK